MRFFFVILSLLTVLGLCAQDEPLETTIDTAPVLYPMVWSQVSELDKRGSEISNLGADGQFLYSLARINNREAGLELLVHRKKDMAQLANMALLLPSHKGEPTNLLRAFLCESSILVFSVTTDAETRALVIYLTLFDKQGLLLEMPRLVETIPSSARKKEEDVFLSISPDRENVLLSFVYPKMRGEGKKFELQLFGANASTKWKQNIQLPYKEDYFQIAQYAVDNDERVWMLTGENAEKQRARQLVKNERMHYLLVFDKAKSALKQIDINLKESWIHSIAMEIDKNGDLLIGGFYSQDFYFSIAGVFAMKISGSDRKVTYQDFFPLSTDFYNSFPNRNKREKNQELENFYFDGLRIKSDGSIVLLAEEYYVEETMNIDPSTGRQNVNYLYYFGDVLLVELSPQIELKSEKRVDKLQVSSNDNGLGSGYAYGYNGQKDLFVFTDHEDKLTATARENQELNNWRRAKLQVVVWEAGEPFRASLNEVPNKTLFVPERSLFIPNEGFVLQAIDGRDYALGWVKP